LSIASWTFLPNSSILSKTPCCWFPAMVVLHSHQASLAITDKHDRRRTDPAATASGHHACWPQEVIGAHVPLPAATLDAPGSWEVRCGDLVARTQRHDVACPGTRRTHPKNPRHRSRHPG